MLPKLLCCKIIPGHSVKQIGRVSICKVSLLLHLTHSHDFTFLSGLPHIRCERVRKEEIKWTKLGNRDDRTVQHCPLPPRGGKLTFPKKLKSHINALMLALRIECPCTFTTLLVNGVKNKGTLTQFNHIALFFCPEFIVLHVVKRLYSLL